MLTNNVYFTYTHTNILVNSIYCIMLSMLYLLNWNRTRNRTTCLGFTWIMVSQINVDLSLLLLYFIGVWFTWSIATKILVSTIWKTSDWNSAVYIITYHELLEQYLFINHFNYHYGWMLQLIYEKLMITY